VPQLRKCFRCWTSGVRGAAGAADSLGTCHAAPAPASSPTARSKRRTGPCDNLYFVNQDNWALPAVENSLLDAKAVTDTINGML